MPAERSSGIFVMEEFIGNGMPGMLAEYAAEEPQPEIFRELRWTEDELNRLPGELRRTFRAELPPGHGIVSSSAMLIFTPSP